MCISSTRLCLHEIKIFIGKHGKLSILLRFDIAISTQNENISHQIVACINSVFDENKIFPVHPPQKNQKIKFKKKKKKKNKI
jgi:hypothetical protein